MESLVAAQPLRRGDACLMCRAKKLVSLSSLTFGGGGGGDAKTRLSFGHVEMLSYQTDV